MLDFFAGETYFVAYNFSSGWMELAFVFCQFKGAQGLPVAALKSIGIVEGDPGLAFTELNCAEQWPAGHDMGETIVVVESKDGQTMTEWPLRVKMDIE